MKFISNANAPSRQRGAALVVALIMLLVMTVLGITAMQVTRMEERMAGNSRDVNLAFQAAEAGLRDGEVRVQALSAPPLFCTGAPCPATRAWNRGTWMTDHRDETAAWWTTNSLEYGVAGTREVTEVTADPRVVAEHLMFIPDSLSIGDEEAEDGRDFYRITATSTGASTTANAVLETTFTRRRY